MESYGMPSEMFPKKQSAVPAVFFPSTGGVIFVNQVKRNAWKPGGFVVKNCLSVLFEQLVYRGRINSSLLRKTPKQNN